MAMPPIFKNENNQSYFDTLLENAKPILDENNITVDISGYKETMNSLAALKLSDYNAAWQLSLELNAWSDYLSDIRSNCKRILNNLEAEKMSIIATASLVADKVKVSNGDRLANKDEKVVEIRKKRNTMESLCELLDSKIAYMERAHYLCKKTFETAQDKEITKK